MQTRKCNLIGKTGIEELDHQGSYAVIANRTLYDHGKANKFAVVNKHRALLNDVYRNLGHAEQAIRQLSGRA